MTTRAERRPNHRLASLVEEAGFSHAGLARRVDQLGAEQGLDLRYDKTSVARWLRGQHPRGIVPMLLAEVFTQRLSRKLTAEDLGMAGCRPDYAGLEYAAGPGEAVEIVSGMWQADSARRPALAEASFTPGALVVPSRDWLIGAGDEDPQRAEGVRVGPGDVVAVRAVGEAFRRLDNSFGGGHARQALVRYLDTEVTTMLRGSYNAAVGRDLFAAAAVLTRLVGWMAYDTGVHGMAQRYFVQALRLAQASGDRSLGAYVLTTMSRQAIYLGHGREAVQLARVAQQGALAGATPRVRVLLYAVEARGHGLLGDVRACLAALSRAEQALAQASPEIEEPDWAAYLDEAQLADEYAHCFRDLEDHRKAREFAERSLRLRGTEYTRSRLFCSTVLATALLGLGELDHACGIEAEATESAEGLRSARAMDYVREFSHRLSPYRDSPAVRDFAERTDPFLCAAAS
ncbi:regulator [Yinghuangia sp. ASG 101]|uniref:regulator n=1 Tax=Yinghuangia sp. ASG 101 TaxID=2896848 RepID=UPI001E559697|nr:regulator [Yinghuangia sp. ASG 101]UGQ09955.1 regulator [Yinghuangia sp. ASG 101]